MKEWDFYIRDITVRVKADSPEHAYEIFENDIEPKMKELGIDYDECKKCRYYKTEYCIHEKEKDCWAYTIPLPKLKGGRQP